MNQQAHVKDDKRATMKKRITTTNRSQPQPISTSERGTSIGTSSQSQQVKRSRFKFNLSFLTHHKRPWLKEKRKRRRHDPSTLSAILDTLKYLDLYIIQIPIHYAAMILLIVYEVLEFLVTQLFVNLPFKRGNSIESVDNSELMLEEESKLGWSACGKWRRRRRKGEKIILVLDLDETLVFSRPFSQHRRYSSSATPRREINNSTHNTHNTNILNRINQSTNTPTQPSNTSDSSTSTTSLSTSIFNLIFQPRSIQMRLEVFLPDRPDSSVLFQVTGRPHLVTFLRRLACLSCFDLVLYTASEKHYADPVVDWIERICNRQNYDDDSDEGGESGESEGDEVEECCDDSKQLLSCCLCNQRAINENDNVRVEFKKRLYKSDCVPVKLKSSINTTSNNNNAVEDQTVLVKDLQRVISAYSNSQAPKSRKTKLKTPSQPQPSMSSSSSMVADHPMLSRMILIDDSPLNFALQPSNGIEIRAFRGEPADSELLDLMPVLEALATMFKFSYISDDNDNDGKGDLFDVRSVTGLAKKRFSQYQPNN